MIYLDSSALVKLVRHELETPALLQWLNSRRGSSRVSSSLSQVEVARALRRHDAGALSQMDGAMAHLYLVEIGGRIRTLAASYEDPLLRSLDAIHLATADLLVRDGHDLEAFVAYDDRLLKAADDRRLPTARPGPSAP